LSHNIHKYIYRSCFALNSGTLGAALEANLNGVRSIALNFSIYNYPNCTSLEISSACRLSVQLIQHLLRHWPAHVPQFSLNVPAIVTDQPVPVHLTTIHQNQYGSLFKCVDGQGKTFKFSPQIDEVLKAFEAKEGSDAWAVSNRFVSITPILPSYVTAENVDLKLQEFSQS
jgi:5'/3'-nucleotidase SurE